MKDAEIEKIENQQEKPDLFCEKIDIDKEYRAVVYIYKNGDVHLIYLAERIPHNDKIKNLREQDLSFLKNVKQDGEGNFEWKLYDPENQTISDNISHIIKDCIDLNSGVQILAIDFCVDIHGKWWYIECNMSPGMSYYLSVSIYLHAYQDWYNAWIEKSNPFHTTLMNLAKKYIEYTISMLPEYQNPDFQPNLEGKRLIF